MIKRIYFVVLPQAHIIYLSGPLQIFNEFNELGNSQVDIHLCGPQAKVKLHQNATVSLLEPLPTKLHEGDVVFVVGKKNNDTLFEDASTIATVNWLRDAYDNAEQGMLFCGICTGALLLAKAGVLDDKQCITLPIIRERLRYVAPKARPVGNRVFVRDGNVWTSAGVSAGIDISLELIAHHFGFNAAAAIAKGLMLHMRRTSDYAYMSSTMNYRNHSDMLIHAVQDYISEHLDKDLDESKLAELGCCSYRTLYRRFKACIGIGIKDYQLQLRVDKAKRSLVHTNMSISAIANESGYAEPQSFRYVWAKYEGLSPSEFRRKYKPL